MTVWAHTLDYVFGLVHLEAIGHVDHRYNIILQTIGLAATLTGEVQVVQVTVVLAPAEAILLLSGTVVYDMQQAVLAKETQRAEYARLVKTGYPALYVMQRERLALSAHRFPHQQSHGRGFYAMLLKVCFYVIVCHCLR